VLYPSAFCPQIIKHSHAKIHTEFHKNKKEIVNFCFSVKWQNLFFRQISTERRAPTVHRTGGAFFRLSFVENVRRQKRQTRIFSGFQSSDTQPPFIGRMVRSFGCCPWES